MKVLLAEYTTLHDSTLAPEGAAMLSTLTGSFKRCGYEVITPDNGPLDKEIERLAPLADFGLVIAPDQYLSRYTRILEGLTFNIGCDSMSAAICANKEKTSAILKAHGIRVPERNFTGKTVVKPKYGCGSQGVRISGEKCSPDELVQEYIEGVHLSVSLVASRVVGESCLYYSGAGPLVLSLNQQYVSVDNEGFFHYTGGETPVSHPQEAAVRKAASDAVKVLGCQGYTGVDFVVDERGPVVVDVNPRMTTSILGIAACMKKEIADILIHASQGKLPLEVTFQGRAKYDIKGHVTIQ